MGLLRIFARSRERQENSSIGSVVDWWPHRPWSVSGPYGKLSSVRIGLCEIGAYSTFEAALNASLAAMHKGEIP